MNGYHSKQPRFWRGLSLAIGLTSVLLWPSTVSAQEAIRESAKQQSAKQQSTKQEDAKRERRQEQPLSWARIDYILNDVELVPRRSRSRTARVADVLGIGDALRTLVESTAELKFNDGSEVRIGQMATFRFTPNTRNFQLSDGTALFLIPPGRGRTTIQTPNAVTGIQGSALFVRYIEERDITIVGSLTDNPDGPMRLYTEDGTQEQALYSNQVGVVEGDRITEVYDLDAQMFWETSGLAETFDYTEDVGSAVDDLDGVRQEIRDAIDSQGTFDEGNIVENPEKFSLPEREAQASESESGGDSAEELAGSNEEGEPQSGDSEDGSSEGGGSTEDDAGLTIEIEDSKEEEQEIQYEGSPAEEFHNQDKTPATPAQQAPRPSAALTEADDEDEDEDEAASTGNDNRPSANTNQAEGSTSSPDTASRSNSNDADATSERSRNDRPATNNRPAVVNNTADEELVIDESVLPDVPDSDTPEILAPPNVAEDNRTPNPTPVAQPNTPTEGIAPLPPAALTDSEDAEDAEDVEDEDESVDGSTSGNEDEAPESENSGNEDETPTGESSSNQDDASTEGTNGDETEAPLEGSRDNEDTPSLESNGEGEDEAPTDGDGGSEDEISSEGSNEETRAPGDESSDGEAEVPTVGSDAESPVDSSDLPTESSSDDPVVDEADSGEDEVEVEAVEVEAVEVETGDPNESDPAVVVEEPVVAEDSPDDEALIVNEAEQAPDNPEEAEVVVEEEVIEDTGAGSDDGTDAELVVFPEESVDSEEAPATPEVPEDEPISPEALEAPEDEVAAPEASEIPEVLEDEPIAPEAFEASEDEVAAPEVSESLVEELSVDSVSAEEPPEDFAVEPVEGVSPVETIEEAVPVQVEEVVPFPVEQVDELSPGQEMTGGNGEPMDMDMENSSNVDDAALSTAFGEDQPELR